MTNTWVAPGLLANILERPGTTLSASQTSLALYPISRIADGRPSQMYLFATAAADDYVQADISQLLNGDLEDWTSGAPDSFTVAVSGTGAVTEETTGAKVVGGAGSGAKLANGASGTAESYQDLEVLSGEPIQFRASGLTSNADSPAEIECQNLQTGLYLNTSGTWQAGQTNCLETTSTSLVQVSNTFAVESFLTTRSHSVTLRFRMHMDAAAASREHNWDGLEVIPGVNLASVHGHNLDAKITAELHSDDASDFSGVTDHGDFTVDVPTFYLKLATTQYYRYWRPLVMTGTQSSVTGPAELGLLFLGNATALLRSPSHSGLSVAELISQEEAATRLSREQWRVKYTKFRQRFASLRFKQTDTMQVQFRDEILKRTNDGVDPMVLIIRDDRTHLCFHGRRPAGRANFVVEGGEVSETELIFEESAWGVVTE